MTLGESLNLSLGAGAKQLEDVSALSFSSFSLKDGEQVENERKGGEGERWSGEWGEGERLREDIAPPLAQSSSM